MDTTVKKYVQASDALRNAYDELRRGGIQRKEFLSETYQPILEKLGKMTTTNDEETVSEMGNEQEEFEPVLKRMGPVAVNYLKMYYNKRIKTDKSFGVHAMDDNIYIGNLPILIVDNNIQFEDGQIFEGTEGLWELLTLEKPEQYTKTDYENYTKIVLKTNTYRRNNDPNETKLKNSRGYKWLNIIKPILLLEGVLASTGGKKRNTMSLVDEMSQVKGSGIEKILTNKPVEYVYWNTIDELLEKLYILYGEIRAGNNNPSLYNEISSILTEIREL